VNDQPHRPEKKSARRARFSGCWNLPLAARGKQKRERCASGAVFAPPPREDGTGRQPGDWRSTEAGGVKHK